MKHHEFWHPRIFEFPYYVYLLWLCLWRGIGIKTLAKANYGLDHGEIGLSSKFDSQNKFDQSYFLPTILLKDSDSEERKLNLLFDFAQEHDYPVLLKSNLGSVGKGIVKINSAEEARIYVPRLLGDYMLQKFTTLPFEAGVFFVREGGVGKISGINAKHFPTVVGNGRDDISTLVKNHPRFSGHWNAFLKEIDTTQVLDEGESKRLSYIGSHTLGCKFTDDTDLNTPKLEQSVNKLFDSQAGFNFGRADLRAESEEALQNGEFVVIEVNGVASLPTHMFDPKFSVWQSYAIFMRHARYLADIASEHRGKPMHLMSYLDVIRQARKNAATLNLVHQALMGSN